MKRRGFYAACQKINSYPRQLPHKKSKWHFNLPLRLLKLLKPSGWQQATEAKMCCNSKFCKLK